MLQKYDRKRGILTALKHLVCLLKESIQNLTDALLINFTLSVTGQNSGLFLGFF